MSVTREIGMSVEEIRKLIVVAQSDEEVYANIALTDLLIEIMDNYMERHISKYYRKATVGVLDADDMRQIFLLACSRAIEQADPFIGNPMLYILQKGKWAITDELRKGYRRNIRQYCHSCDTETRLNERGGTPICPKCGESEEGQVERVQVNVSDDGTAMEFKKDDNMDIEESVAGDILVEEFRKRLAGRKADVFDLIYYHGYDRNSCTNYQKEIAEVLGITTSNVNLRLRQIKEEWREFVEEQSLDI